MKKRLNTYGISGLIECQVVIKIGNKSKMKVSFNDGSTTASGVKPATFTTDNYIIQHAIEHSLDYKRGRIHRVSSIELNEDIKIGRNKETASMETSQPELPPKAEGSSQLDGENSQLTPQSQSDPLPLRGTVHAAQQVESLGIEEGSVEKVQVSDLSEAKEYLAERFGINRSLLRSMKSITEHAMAHNIEFEGI